MVRSLLFLSVYAGSRELSSQKIASEAEAGDSCGNSASRRPCRSASDEAAEAVPAESVRLERNAKKLPRFLDSLKKLATAIGCQFFYSSSDPVAGKACSA